MSIIKTVKGDLIELFDTQFDAIAHGCNCFHTMGAGIAKQIKEKFPQAYVADKETIYGDQNKLGTFSSTLILGKGFVINAYTQFNTGRNVDYKAIYSSFIAINTKVQWYMDRGWRNCLEPRFQLGIPKIGAGIAGGDWDVISEIIDEVTPDIDITLVEWSK